MTRTDGDAALPAGRFSVWLADMAAALAGERDAEVPCDGCTACCTSSQFVHIGPEEVDTLAHVPAALLFPAPRLPAGNVVLGYDENGHCPMLVGGACSIYAHRPRTCRTYDCRIFAATAVAADAESQPAVAARAARWRFELADDRDREQHAAACAAAAAIDDATSATEHAVRAIRAVV